jgi:group I intron endonuclease
MIGIYQIKNTITNQIYIGSSKNIKDRWRSHKSPAHCRRTPNKQLYKDFQELGLESFEFTVLEECKIDELRQREQLYIDTLHLYYNTNRAFTTDEQKRQQRLQAVRQFTKELNNKICCYQGREYKFKNLYKKLRRLDVEHPTTEAKKYLVS